jgi:hypothetical protein
MAIFQRFEFLERDMSLTCFQQVWRAQKASYVIGAE